MPDLDELGVVCGRQVSNRLVLAVPVLRDEGILVANGVPRTWHRGRADCLLGGRRESRSAAVNVHGVRIDFADDHFADLSEAQKWSEMSMK
jgi:hypothetical protein